MMTPMTAGILTAGGMGEILMTGAGITEECSQDEWYSRFYGGLQISIGHSRNEEPTRAHSRLSPLRGPAGELCLTQRECGPKCLSE